MRYCVYVCIESAGFVSAFWVMGCVADADSNHNRGLPDVVHMVCLAEQTMLQSDQGIFLCTEEDFLTKDRNK